MEVCCSYRHCARTCKKEFDCIFCTGNSTHSDDRNVNSLCHLINHANCNWFHDRSGYSSGLIRYRKCLSVDINLHSCQCIDQRYRICSTGFCCSRNFCDICYIRCQFHNDRLLCDLLNLRCQLFHIMCILSKCKKSCINVRTGNIDLHHINRFVCKTLYNCKIFFRSVSAYIYDDLCIKILQIWNISLAEQIDSRILKSDGVHHTAINFSYTRGRVSCPRYICYTFRCHCSKTVQVYKF